MKRMTVGQLAMTVNERIFLCSMYDVSHDVELTRELRAYTGILTLEILTMSCNEDGYMVCVDLPAAAVAALEKSE